MTEKMSQQSQDEQPKPKTERPANSKQFEAKAKKTIKQLRRGAEELTEALGLPPEETSNVLRMVRSDLFSSELTGQQGEEHEVYSKDTAPKKDTPQNTPNQ